MGCMGYNASMHNVIEHEGRAQMLYAIAHKALSHTPQIGVI